uniref:non-specific serine/threonine protein kinase n=1 Tax=Paramormyrops kingsleyae TaxID=1676925 RepID=A0A3B3SSD3_9TELE
KKSQTELLTQKDRQLSFKRQVALRDRSAELDGFPHLAHWCRIVDMRKEVIEEIGPCQLTLEALLDMSDEQVCETVQKLGASPEECARLNASLSCLRSVHQSGEVGPAKQDWAIQWPASESGKENAPACPQEPSQWMRFQLSQSPKVQSKYSQPFSPSPQTLAPSYSHVDRLTVEAHAALFPVLDTGHRSLPPSPRQRHFPHTPPRTPLVVHTMTPPGTPPARRRNKGKAPGTPPPSTRKLIHLLPGFTALHRSKSHEFQLGNLRPSLPPLNLKIQSTVGSCENIPSQRSPLHTERTLRSFFFPSFLPSTPPVHSDTTFSASECKIVIRCMQLFIAIGRILTQFSTKYWMSQTCVVCGKGMLFGLKCKNCKLKCHNKCTKEAPPCHLLIIHRGARLVRTESVPCDINNPLRYTDLHISQTLPKTNKINKDHIPVPYQPDSSSNPSSTTSSTPSSPAPPLPPSATPPSPLHPSPQCTRQQKQFNLTGRHPDLSSHLSSHPDVTPEVPNRAPQVVLHPVLSEPGQVNDASVLQNEEGNDEAEVSEDEFEEMNLSLLSARNFPRKASQTSIFLQEWDIPFEQLEVGELIGKGRFGQVFHGRWHGEVAIRLIDIERDNEDQLKAFKREVMAYRNTRHENVVLFMGACMSPPHLAIITSPIITEFGMGYLHAKGILHKDMKSKNVFYDNGKVVITDFGLFTISGVLQAGRREDKLRIPSGWLCHLAPEIIRQLSPDTEEDKLPFSKQSDVFAFGTIWYELHAREWPFKNQPAEAIIWQVGSGMKPNLSQIGMGKEISDILLFCWAFKQEERPSFSKLVDLLEKLPKRNRRLSHPGHFWKSAEYVK